MRHAYRIILFLALLGAAPALTATSQNLSVPLDALGERAREKVEALLQDHTLKRTPVLEHPILNRSIHQFLLDRPDVGAALTRILGIGKYTMTRVGKEHFHGSDGEGAEGDLDILYRDEAHRVYFMKGLNKGAVTTVRGKAIILQEFEYRTTDEGENRVESRLTIYARVENPLLALLLKIFAPFIGRLVDNKITKAQGAVQEVSEAMVHDPQETYRRIKESDELASEDLTMLRQLMKLPDPSAIP